MSCEQDDELLELEGREEGGVGGGSFYSTWPLGDCASVSTLGCAQRLCCYAFWSCGPSGETVHPTGMPGALCVASSTTRVIREHRLYVIEAKMWFLTTAFAKICA